MGVAEITAGDWTEGAGDVEGLSKLFMAPLLGSLIWMPAFFLAGILKLPEADLGAGLLAGPLDIGMLLTAALDVGVCDLPMLEGGRSADSEMAEDVRDIDGGCEG